MVSYKDRDIGVGDVVVFNSSFGRTPIAHRVVSVKALFAFLWMRQPFQNKMISLTNFPSMRFIHSNIQLIINLNIFCNY